MFSGFIQPNVSKQGNIDASTDATCFSIKTSWKRVIFIYSLSCVNPVITKLMQANRIFGENKHSATKLTGHCVFDGKILIAAIKYLHPDLHLA